MRDKEEQKQVVLRRYGQEMQRLRDAADRGEALAPEEERRLQAWEESGQVEEPDSTAMVLYGGSSRLNAATMRNQKALQHIEKIYRSKIE